MVGGYSSSQPFLRLNEWPERVLAGGGGGAYTQKSRRVTAGKKLE